MTFSKDIKEGTKKSHSAAENTSFVKSFLGGCVKEENYRKLVADFYYVYRALEERMDTHAMSPVLGPLQELKELNRTRALEKDLKYFYGDNWFMKIKPSDSCQSYVNRIMECEEELLVGHHYTRYLGDLSGGQILKTIAEKAMNLEQGLDFYKFDIEDKKEYKAKYRKILDTLPLTVSQQNAIIVEANFAFRLNMYMFDELDGSAAIGAWQVFFNTMFNKG